jgi:hypothetical protein
MRSVWTVLGVLALLGLASCRYGRGEPAESEPDAGAESDAALESP